MSKTVLPSREHLEWPSLQNDAHPKMTKPSVVHSTSSSCPSDMDSLHDSLLHPRHPKLFADISVLQRHVRILYVLVAGLTLALVSSQALCYLEFSWTDQTLFRHDNKANSLVDIEIPASELFLEDTQMPYSSPSDHLGIGSAGVFTQGQVESRRKRHIPLPFEGKILEHCREIQKICAASGPRGLPGAVGSKGRVGAKGERGFKGRMGDRGVAGVTGKDGSTGEKGRTGDPGRKGERGSEGPTGPMGPKGDAGDPGLTGEKGHIGDKGWTGPKGDRGFPGVIGKDGRAGQKGDTGRYGQPGIDGARGETGPMGPPGIGQMGLPGVPGLKGEPGRDGQPGRDGAKGETGPMGPQGTSGQMGLPGVPGLKGQQGDKGLPGEPGRDAQPYIGSASEEKAPMGLPGNSDQLGLTGVPVLKVQEGDRGLPDTETTAPTPTFPPRVTECSLDDIGTSVRIRDTNQTQGAWMTDTKNPTKAWVTCGLEGSTVIEYNSVENLTADLPSKEISLFGAPFVGNGHVVYDGFLYYHRIDTPTIIRFNLTSEQATTLRNISDLDYRPKTSITSGGFLYQANSTFVQFALDENGLWLIYTSETTENITVALLNPETLDIVKSVPLDLEPGSKGGAFIACGKLYTLKDSARRRSNLDEERDLWSGQKRSISITFNNPYGQTSMMSYDSSTKTIQSWHEGTIVSHPLLLKPY